MGKTLDSSVSTDDYREVLKDYIDNPLDELAVNELKECFLSQSNETLANFGVMMVSWFLLVGFQVNFLARIGEKLLPDKGSHSKLHVIKRCSESAVSVLK